MRSRFTSSLNCIKSFISSSKLDIHFISRLLDPSHLHLAPPLCPCFQEPPAYMSHQTSASASPLPLPQAKTPKDTDLPINESSSFFDGWQLDNDSILEVAAFHPESLEKSLVHFLLHLTATPSSCHDTFDKSTLLLSNSTTSISTSL